MRRSGEGLTAGLLAAALAGAVLLVAACGDAGAGQTPGTTVVATTSILGDIARQVAGDAATVTVLVPIGADPHEYQASSRQAAALQKADLVIANGLGLEAGLQSALDAAAADGANIVEIAPLLDPLSLPGEGHDPHVWLDPIRMAEAARLVAGELAAIDGGEPWAARAEAYAAELEEADREIAAILAEVPADRRKLVTNHDSLGYFAARYGFEVVGVVVPGGSTLAEPSSSDLAALVARISRAGVPAIFAETTEPSAVAEAIAAEAGADIEVVELYVGSLGEPGSGADTLIGMLLTNARLIATALS